MGRPRYRITQDDYSTVLSYIKRARERGEVSSASGFRAFAAATTPELLQAWCDDYLPAQVWKKMLTSLRQSRMRSRDYKRKPRYHIDLTHPAYIALTRVAKEMGNVTFSKAIERLEECYWIVNDQEKAAAPIPRCISKSGSRRGGKPRA